jgi:hypothetical protein
MRTRDSSVACQDEARDSQSAFFLAADKLAKMRPICTATSSIACDAQLEDFCILSFDEAPLFVCVVAEFFLP